MESQSGQQELALQLLKQTVREGFGTPELIRNDPLLAPLHGKPEFRLLVTRFYLLRYFSTFGEGAERSLVRGVYRGPRAQPAAVPE